MKKVFSCFAALLMCATMWAEPITVRLKASSLPKGWGDVSIYYWGAESPGNWPGEKLTEVDGWYTKTFKETTTSISIIWNNNDEGKQTVDLSDVKTSTSYAINGGAGTKHTVEILDRFAKNNWDTEKDWTWKHMTMVDDNTHTLDRVVYGGTGININNKADDSDDKWFSEESIGGDKIKAGDTIKLVYKVDKDTLTATLLGRPVKPVYVYDTVQYVAGNFTHWKSEMKALPYAITLPKDSTLEFKQVRVITTKDSATQEVVKKDTAWYGQATKDYYMTRENVGKGWKLDGEHNVWLTTDVAGEYTFQLNGESFKVDFPEKAVQIFAKNNWDGGDWTWKEMKHDSTTIYSLVDVFGGTGVDINTKADDNEGKIWFGLDKIGGDSIGAGDTIQLVFDLADSTLEAAVLGRPYVPVYTYDTTMYVAGNFTGWAAGMQKLPLTIALSKDSTIAFKQVRVIDTKDDLTVVKSDTAWFGQATKDYKMTRENVGEGWKLDGEHDVLLTTDAAGEYTFKLNGESFLVIFPDKPIPSYGILLNETTYHAGEPKDIEGGKEYKVDIALKVDDEVQLYDSISKAAWIVEPEQEGYTDFTKDYDNQKYIITNAGQYQFYVKIYNNATSGLYVSCQTTALDEVLGGNDQTKKMMKNGQMFIIRNGQTYNVQGSRL